MTAMQSEEKVAAKRDEGLKTQLEYEHNRYKKTIDFVVSDRVKPIEKKKDMAIDLESFEVEISNT